MQGNLCIKIHIQFKLGLTVFPLWRPLITTPVPDTRSPFFELLVRAVQEHPQTHSLLLLPLVTPQIWKITWTSGTRSGGPKGANQQPLTSCWNTSTIIMGHAYPGCSLIGPKTSWTTWGGTPLCSGWKWLLEFTKACDGRMSSTSYVKSLRLKQCLLAFVLYVWSKQLELRCNFFRAFAMFKAV